MRRLPAIISFLAFSAFGCGQASSVGAGGAPGTGGFGGAAGGGGAAGAGNRVAACEPVADRCSSGTTAAYEACCEQPVPDLVNACDGTESVENPAGCTSTGTVVTYRLTLMEAEGDCNVGYDLDACDGTRCVPFSLTPAEGTIGIDNGLAGVAAKYEDIGANLASVNKAFSDGLCGRTDRDCGTQVPPVEIRFVIDANDDEKCARVAVLFGGESSEHVLNLSDDGCVSGTLGSIPIPAVGETGSFENTVVRMTVSPAGFAHGRLGGTMDTETARSVLRFMAETGVAVFPFDVNAATPTESDPTAQCDGLSATLRIGGIAE